MNWNWFHSEKFFRKAAVEFSVCWWRNFMNCTSNRMESIDNKYINADTGISDQFQIERQLFIPCVSHYFLIFCWIFISNSRIIIKIESFVFPSTNIFIWCELLIFLTLKSPSLSHSESSIFNPDSYESYSMIFNMVILHNFEWNRAKKNENKSFRNLEWQLKL